MIEPNTGTEVLQESIKEPSEHDVREAYDHCLTITRAHYENFPVASLLIPRGKRSHIGAIYAFARIADDMADEGTLPADERLARLGEWQRKLDNCYEGIADDRVFIALRRTVHEFRIPKDLFAALLTAFRQDVVKRRYESFEELLEYCRNSANPVGRLVLLIFGYHDDALFRYSDYICTALQLTNFWQDIDVDRKKNRIYVPIEDMERFDYSEEDLLARRGTDEFRRMMQLQIERSRALFRAGYPLTRVVGSDLRLELSVTWLGGSRILDKIERADYDVFTHRPELSVMDFIPIMMRAVTGRVPKGKRRAMYVS